MKRIVLSLMVVGLPFSACKRDAHGVEEPISGPVEPHPDEQGHAELPRQLKLTAEALQTSGVKWEAVRREALKGTVSLPGELVAQPDRKAQLSTTVPGRLESISFNEGSAVKKGDVLAVLRVPDVGRLRGTLAATQARAKAAASNVERLEALRASGLGAEQALVDAKAEASAQDAEAKALAEQLRAIGAGDGTSGFLVPLRAPISGVVVARDAVLGQPIGAEHVLATIVDLSELWFVGRIFEKDLGRLTVGARSDVQLNAFPGEHFGGVVQAIGLQTDPVARTLTARIAVPNETSRLRLGLFGTASVEIAGAEQLATHIVVPLAAVSDLGGRKVVFVRAADGDFVVHDVTLGEAALARVQILSGLDEGEQVVVSGTFTLKSLLLKSTLAEGEE
ncbi:MAG: efflux RND transporter periplasmic adaptor subunit [Archangium sp.]